MSRKSRKTLEAAVEAPAVELEVETPAIEAEAPEAEAPEVVTRSVVPRKWRNVYNHNPLKGTCNDALAIELNAILKSGTLSLVALGELNNVDVQSRWGARNPGMQRMNLGNVLRNRIKRGEHVNLG